jgi:hypothetical protein
MIMSKTITFAAVLGSALILSACQAEMLSNDRIISNTAQVIGVRPDQFMIMNRVSDDTNTYYTARTRSGVTFACVINGGGLLAAGMTDPPTCNQTTGG